MVQFRLVLLCSIILCFSVIPSTRTCIATEQGPIYIHADGSIDPPTSLVSSTDNITYTLTGDIRSTEDGIIVQRNNTVIDGNGHSLFGRDGMAIYTIGMNLTAVNNVTVKNADIMGFSEDIRLSHSNNITITGNTFAGNNVTSGRSAGIDLDSSSNNNITGNVFVNAGLGVFGSFGNVVMSNVVNGKPLVYLEDSSDQTIGNAGQVVLVHCNRIKIENLTLFYLALGIELYETNNTSLFNNTITNGDEGIFLYSSHNNSIDQNNVVANLYYGITIFSSCNNSLTNNNLTANNWQAVDLESSSGTLIMGNNISDSTYGLYINDSSNNMIYHNNFFNNRLEQAAYSFSSNIWDDDYPSGGNYWSDYAGIDQKNGPYQNLTGSDGIGDTPYLVNADQHIQPIDRDNYPLMGTFHSYNVTYFTPPMVGHFCEVDVVSSSTISAFTAPIWLEHPEVIFLTFNVTGASGSTGFCRVSFPNAMMNGTYHVIVNGTEVLYTLLPSSNTSVSYLYFNYEHSTEQVEILPEFQPFVLLPLLTITTLLTTAAYKRKRD